MLKNNIQFVAKNTSSLHATIYGEKKKFQKVTLRVTNLMVKLLVFRFRVTNSRLKNKKIHQLSKKNKNKKFITSSMGALLFSHIRVTNVKLINEKISLNITV